MSVWFFSARLFFGTTCKCTIWHKGNKIPTELFVCLFVGVSATDRKRQKTKATHNNLWYKNCQDDAVFCFNSVVSKRDCLWEEHTTLWYGVDQSVFTEFCVVFSFELLNLFVFFVVLHSAKIPSEFCYEIIEHVHIISALNVLNAVYYVHTISSRIVAILSKSHQISFILHVPHRNFIIADDRNIQPSQWCVYIHCVWRTKLYWVNPVFWKHSMHILLS